MDVARERRRRFEKRDQDRDDDQYLAHLKHQRHLKELNRDMAEDGEANLRVEKARARVIRQAILRRLGASDASELRNEIVGVFNLFDTDGSGKLAVLALAIASDLRSVRGTAMLLGCACSTALYSFSCSCSC